MCCQPVRSRNVVPGAPDQLGAGTLRPALVEVRQTPRRGPRHVGPDCLMEDEVGPVDKKSGASIADVTLVERERRGSSQVFCFLVVRVLSGDARRTTKRCGRKHLPVGGQ